MNSIFKNAIKLCIFCFLYSLSVTSFSYEGFAVEKSKKIGFLPDTNNLTSDTLYQFGTSDFLSDLLYHTYSFQFMHWFDLKEEANNPDLIEKILKNNQLDYLYQTKLSNENNQWNIELIEWSKENNSFKSLGKFSIKEDDFFNSQFQIAQKILSSQGINLSSSQMQDLNYIKSNYLNIQAYKQFLKGYILYLKGDYATSEQIFKQAITLDEKQVRYKYYHAYSLFYQEKNTEAQNEFINAEKSAQNHPKILSGIGEYYNQINEFEKGIDYFSRALAINSNDSQFYLGRCESNYYLSQFEKSIADCNRALDFGGNNWWNYHLLGLSFYGKKEYSKAISFLSKSIEVNPSNAPSYSWRCKTVLEMNQSNQQIEIESGIGVVFPKYTLPLNLRKNTEQDCNKSVELAPDWGYAYLNRGLFWMSQNEDNKALIDLNKSRELDSNMHESALMRGLLNFKLKKQEQGLKDLSEAIKLGSKDPIPYSLAITLNAIGKHQQSLLLLRPLIELEFSRKRFSSTQIV
jgi:tetratricopeptide (TPR) repeat protein